MFGVGAEFAHCLQERCSDGLDVGQLGGPARLQRHGGSLARSRCYLARFSTTSLPAEHLLAVVQFNPIGCTPLAYLGAPAAGLFRLERWRERESERERESVRLMLLRLLLPQKTAVTSLHRAATAPLNSQTSGRLDKALYLEATLW